MDRNTSDLYNLQVQNQRKNNNTATQSWTYPYCLEPTILPSPDELWKYTKKKYYDKFLFDSSNLQQDWRTFENDCVAKRPAEDESIPKKYIHNNADTEAELPPLPSKRPLNSPSPTMSLSRLQTLNLGPNHEYTTIEDLSKDIVEDQLRKRVAVGDGIYIDSASQEASGSLSPRGSKAQQPQSPMDIDFRQYIASSQRPKGQATKTRTQARKTGTRRSRKSSPQLEPRSAPHSSQYNHHNSRSDALPTALHTISQSEDNTIILQPETRPIPQEQLVAEVKGIYAGLVMVEAKCIEVDKKQMDSSPQPKLNDEQWQALIMLHRTLLDEHHDFFLASQHPSASLALNGLASKYAMPARIWRHGIHSFLELLRHRLPASFDHMLTFLYLAYSMMALLYETVPAFEDTWIECLGDLARYRMAIEDDDIRDREIWTRVSRQWYSKASNKAPTIGRLYHHLAILARPNALQQLYYYAKSLCVITPFTSTRESILTLFDPVLSAENGQGQYRLPLLDTAFIRAHAHLFTNRTIDRFDTAANEFLGLLDSQIGRVTKKFLEQGYQISISNTVAVLSFGSKDNPIMKAIVPTTVDKTDIQIEGTQNELSMVSFRHAERLSNSALDIVLQRIGDPNCLSYIHCVLVFIHYISRFPDAIDLLAPAFPWQSLAIYLNGLLKSYNTLDRIQDNNFPIPEKDDIYPFPEDYAMRGLLYTEGLYPEKWFLGRMIDEEEKYHELPSMVDQCRECILWLAHRITATCLWLRFDSPKRKFSVGVKDTDLEMLKSHSTILASGTALPRAETGTNPDVDDLSPVLT